MVIPEPLPLVDSNTGPADSNMGPADSEAPTGSKQPSATIDIPTQNFPQVNSAAPAVSSAPAQANPAKTMFATPSIPTSSATVASPNPAFQFNPLGTQQVYKMPTNTQPPLIVAPAALANSLPVGLGVPNASQGGTFKVPAKSLRSPPDEAHDVASDDHVRRDVSGLIQLTLDSGLPLRSDWPRKAVRPLWRCMFLLRM